MNLKNIILINFIHLIFANGFGLFSFRNGYRYLMKEIVSEISSLDTSLIQEKWIDQKLDHLDCNDNRTWKMRYFERLDYWKPDGPVYLFINGEAEADSGFLKTGILYELAKETDGAMYLSEHRYYGKSMPFKDLTAEKLTYLSARQALADIAMLINKIKMEAKFKSSKIVVIGGSYAGNLAAWMKLLYPDLIDAAIASSAPVLAKKDFYEYLENVSDDFEQHGTPDCKQRISEIFNKYDKLFQSKEGIEQLMQEERICNGTDMEKSENKQLFFLDKTSEFMYKAQYGNPDKIKAHCDSINDTNKIFSSRDDEAIIWNNKYSCFDYDFDSMIASMKETDWLISWTYQTCTEFSYFSSTSSNKHPFTDNIHMDMFYKMCIKLFGSGFDEERITVGVMKTNKLYGGLKPNVTNVVFVNGDLDPYHRLGILEDVSYDAPAKVIPQASHCRDLFSDRKGDPEELIEARKYVKYLIKKWIGAGEYKNPVK